MVQSSEPIGHTARNQTGCDDSVSVVAQRIQSGSQRKPRIGAGIGDNVIGLSPRQEQILEYIRVSIDDNGYPPTWREIGEKFSIRSTNAVSDHLMALERKGYIVIHRNKSRCIQILGEPEPNRKDDKVNYRMLELELEVLREKLRQVKSIVGSVEI
jgi:hypothetical protein